MAIHLLLCQLSAEIGAVLLYRMFVEGPVDEGREAVRELLVGGAGVVRGAHGRVHALMMS